MNKRIALIAWLGASLLTLHAQKELTLSDAVLKAGTDLAPKRLSGLQWLPGGSAYCHVKDDVLLQGGIGKVADQAVVSLADINAAMEKDKQLKKFPAVEWTDASHLRFMHDSRALVYDLKSKGIAAQAQFPEDAENQEADPVQGRWAYTLGPNLYVTTPGSTKHYQVTNETKEGIVNGVSVHRQEYGITKGTFWSPQGNLLAYYHMDESMVTPYQLEDISSKPSTFKAIRYPMAGQKSHEVNVYVFDTRTQMNTMLHTGEPKDQYLTNITWDPSELFVYVVHLDRKTENLRVVQYDVKTGKPVRTLFEEINDKYLEPEHTLHFLKRTPSQYIWWSERDGWQHLYLYDLKAGMIRQLTKGKWEVLDILGTDDKEGFLYVEGTGDPTSKPATNATETHLYRVGISTGETTRLTMIPGTHRGKLSKDGHYLIDQWSSTSVPGRTEILDARSGQVVKALLDAPNPLNDMKVGSVEIVTLMGENKQQLFARLIKPSGFDSRRKYPVLVYVYGGPHVQLVTNSWLGGASLWMMHAAERGYLVFTVDGAGTPHRGLGFEQATFRHLGMVEMKDQLHGVNYLKSLPYVDPDRMAVHGWSFGGHMTTSLMVNAPGTFKVGVAGGAVMDWSMYEVMYTERYMDTPEENPEGYAATALPVKADALTGDLLLIHGNQDDVVLPEHGMAFLKSCVDKGMQVDFFMYPGHAHNVRGKDRLHLMTKVLDYIDEKLGATAPPARQVK